MALVPGTRLGHYEAWPRSGRAGRGGLPRAASGSAIDDVHSNRQTHGGSIHQGGVLVTRLLSAAMKGVTLFALVLLLQPSASAQSWSAEEQAVLNQLQTCFRTWSDALAEKNVDVWARACPHDENIVAWWEGENAPQPGLANPLQNFATFAELYASRRARLLEVRPLAVRIRGQAAVVFYYLHWTWLDKQGDPKEGQVKRAEWFFQSQGKWTLAAIMEAPK